MRRTLLAVVVLLASVVSAHAQIPDYPNGCASCGVVSYVDLPKPEATVSRADLTFQGWGFECQSGLPADRVDVWYQDYAGMWHALKQDAYTLTWGLGRTDVEDAYRGACPNVVWNTGWSLRITNPPPTGLRRVQINVWRNPYFQVHRRTYLVID